MLLDYVRRKSQVCVKIITIKFFIPTIIHTWNNNNYKHYPQLLYSYSKLVYVVFVDFRLIFSDAFNETYNEFTI